MLTCARRISRNAECTSCVRKSFCIAYNPELRANTNWVLLLTSEGAFAPPLQSSWYFLMMSERGTFRASQSAVSSPYCNNPHLKLRPGPTHTRGMHPTCAQAKTTPLTTHLGRVYEASKTMDLVPLLVLIILYSMLNPSR
jgi:hypothetical protein